MLLWQLTTTLPFQIYKITSLISLERLKLYLNISVPIMSHVFFNVPQHAHLILKFFHLMCLYGMNTQEAPDTAPTPFVFSSPKGFTLCWHILDAHLPYSPHNFQIEGICKVLDHVDLLSIPPERWGFSLCTC
jgi:hypothetical protein